MNTHPPKSTPNSQAKWRELDSAFAWGVMCRYPEQRLILELLFESRLEFEIVQQVSIAHINGQLGVHIEQNATGENFDPAAPFRFHGGLLSVVVRRAFALGELPAYRTLFSLGWDFGHVIWSYHFGDLEHDPTNADRLIERFQDLPKAHRSAFEPIQAFVNAARSNRFCQDKFPPRREIIGTVQEVSRLLRPLRLEGSLKMTPHVEGALKGFGRVQLMPEEQDPNVYIDGRIPLKLSKVRYSVMDALVDAAEGGLKIDDLSNLSLARDGIKTLKQMTKLKDLKDVFEFPGGKGRGGYRIAPR